MFNACLTGSCATPPCAPFLPDEPCCGIGDFEPDGDVDLRDFRAFQECFGQLGLGACGAGQMAGEGVIDLDDYVEFEASLGGP